LIDKQVRETESISKAVLNSALNDIKKALSKEGEAKLFGQGREWVCQIFELLLSNVELYQQQAHHLKALKLLRAKIQQDSEKESVLLQQHKLQQQQQQPQAQAKKGFFSKLFSTTPKE